MLYNYNGWSFGFVFQIKLTIRTDWFHLHPGENAIFMISVETWQSNDYFAFFFFFRADRAFIFIILPFCIKISYQPTNLTSIEPLLFLCALILYISTGPHMIQLIIISAIHSLKILKVLTLSVPVVAFPRLFLFAFFVYFVFFFRF